MKWMRERDALIAQTMAFVQSVTGKRPDLGQLVAESAGTPVAPVAARRRHPRTSRRCSLTHRLTSEAPKPAQIARPDIRGDFQSEIRARVANFRAHQERFSREREAFGSATMAKVHASLREGSLPPRLEK